LNGRSKVPKRPSPTWEIKGFIKGRGFVKLKGKELKRQRKRTEKRESEGLRIIVEAVGEQ
jgi:hypothetical protein